MNYPNIVIKEADSGRVVTVLSKNHDRAIIYEYLNSQHTYEKPDKNLDSNILNKFKKLLNKDKKKFSQIKSLST